MGGITLWAGAAEGRGDALSNGPSSAGTRTAQLGVGNASRLNLRKLRDKAKVERAVLIVEGWLFGRLRRWTFYSLAELDGTRPTGAVSSVA